VNNAIRMFIHDAPMPNGWRWLRPVAARPVGGRGRVVSTQPDLHRDVQRLGSNTTVVVTTAAFYPSMELKTITIGSPVGDRTVQSYLSSTSVVVSGSNSLMVGKTFAIESGGNFTLPLGFGGQFVGQLTYAADTNRGVETEWSDESTIRQWRANVTSDTGTPYLFAPRVMDTGTPRRRWEMLAYPTPNETLTVEFPYVLHFDSLVALTEVHPAPFGHDEAIKAACKAVCEKEVEQSLGVEWNYYRNIALPNSYRVDAMSAPKKLQPSRGSPSNIRDFRNNSYQRPTVTFNP
jgi:hypothetical protein